MGHVHESHAQRHVTKDTSDQGQKDTIQDHQSINPFHQWTHLCEFRDSCKPSPPTQEASQLLLNHLKKFYLIVRLWHLIVKDVDSNRNPTLSVTGRF